MSLTRCPVGAINQLTTEELAGDFITYFADQFFKFDKRHGCLEPLLFLPGELLNNLANPAFLLFSSLSIAISPSFNQIRDKDTQFLIATRIIHEAWASESAPTVIRDSDAWFRKSKN